VEPQGVGTITIAVTESPPRDSNSKQGQAATSVHRFVL